MQTEFKLLCSLLILALLAPVASAQQGAAALSSTTDLRIGAEFLLPAEDDDWDRSVGASGRLIFWSPQNPQIGLALAIGGQAWEVNEERVWDGQWQSKIAGDATMIPLGASLMSRVPMGAGSWLTLEGGLRYVFVDSSVSYNETFFTPAGVPVESWSWDIDIDDGIVALIGAEIDFPIGIGIALYGGGGYQFDLSKGKMSIDGVSIDYKNSLEALVFTGGLKLEF